MSLELSKSTLNWVQQQTFLLRLEISLCLQDWKVFSSMKGFLKILEIWYVYVHFYLNPVEEGQNLRMVAFSLALQLQWVS